MVLGHPEAPEPELFDPAGDLHGMGECLGRAPTVLYRGELEDGQRARVWDHRGAFRERGVVQNGRWPEPAGREPDRNDLPR